MTHTRLHNEGMFILGFALMIYGFGSFIAKQFFDKDFGLLNRWFEGGTLTAVSLGAGALGLLIVIFSIAAKFGNDEDD